VPVSWRRAGFFTGSDQLEEFLFILLLKYEYLQKYVSEQLEETLHPLVQLDKLFDPFGFILTLLYHHSLSFNSEQVCLTIPYINIKATIFRTIKYLI